METPNDFDTPEFWKEYYMGTGIIIPGRTATFSNFVICPDIKEKWSTKRRRELIWRLKINTAKRNKAIVTALKITSTILILAAMVAILFFATLHHAQIGVQLGIITAVSLLVVHQYIESKFETNADFIQPKHKNKTYY